MRRILRPREVAAAVEEAWTGLALPHDPRLVIVLAAPRYPLETVAELLSARLGEVPLIGCTSSGEIGGGGALTQSLVLWALGGSGVRVSTGYGESESGGLRQAASTAAACLSRLDRRRNTVLVLLSDGLGGDQMDVVRGAYDVANIDVPLVGGCAGDYLAMRQTQQLHGRRVMSGAVVAAAISSEAPIAVGIAHGWEPFGGAMLVSGSAGTVLESLDDQPALDLYLQAHQAPPELWNDPEAFFAFAHVRPIGIVRRERIEIRYVCGADYERRTLSVFAEIPQGARVHLMQGSCQTVLHATDEVCRQAEQNLEGLPAKGFLLLECVARKSLLEEAGLLEESLHFPSLSQQAVLGGFYTYGEIGRSEGAGGLHNQTVVALALA